MENEEKGVRLTQGTIISVTLAIIIAHMIFVSVAYKAGYKKAQEEQKSQSIVGKTEQFVADLEKLAQNPEKSRDYWRIVSKLTTAIGNSVKRNPERMQGFLQDMVNLAVKAGPGLALQVENYANAKLKEEMARLRQESGVAQLAEKDKQISVLQKEVIRAKTLLKEKNEEIRRLKSKLGQPTGEEVPVLLVNDWGYGIAGFKFTNKATGKFWTFYVPPDTGMRTKKNTKEVMLPPGDYKVECHYKGELWAEKEKTVTKEPSTSYRDKWYHCVVQTVCGRKRID